MSTRGRTQTFVTATYVTYTAFPYVQVLKMIPANLKPKVHTKAQPTLGGYC